MGGNVDAPRYKPRIIGPVLWASRLKRWAALFVALFIACSAIVAVFEPSIGGFADSAWFMFQVVTTIGLGDFTSVSFVGRTATVILSIYSIFFIALITSAVVTSSFERMRARSKESVAHFLDQLEHLPELSDEELADLSERVKEFRRKIA